MVGNTKPLSILSTCIATLVMPSKTLRDKVGVRLSCCTWRMISTKLAAIGVIIQDLMIWANLGTRRFSEFDWEDGVTRESSIDIWVCHWLKPYDRFSIVLDVFIRHFYISRLRVLVIHDAQDLQVWIPIVVCGKWFVKWVITSSVGIVRKLCGYGILVGNKRIICVLLPSYLARLVHPSRLHTLLGACIPPWPRHTPLRTAWRLHHSRPRLFLAPWQTQTPPLTVLLVQLSWLHCFVTLFISAPQRALVPPPTASSVSLLWLQCCLPPTPRADVVRVSFLVASLGLHPVSFADSSL